MQDTPRPPLVSLDVMKSCTVKPDAVILLDFGLSKLTKRHESLCLSRTPVAKLPQCRIAAAASNRHLRIALD